MWHRVTHAAAAQSLSELRMVYAGFNGHEVGSDVLLSLNLIRQGLNSITDAYEVKSKLKCLSATRTSAKSVARRVHNTCICGGSTLSCKAPSMHVGLFMVNQASNIWCPVLTTTSCALPCNAAM